MFMPKSVDVHLQMPDDLSRLRLPAGVDTRLQQLLDRQDQGMPLTTAEREEAEGLVDLAEFLSFLRLRSERARPRRNGKR
jgi:hypothetical protein